MATALARLSTEEREAVQMMGGNEDTSEGFEIPERVLKSLWNYKLADRRFMGPRIFYKLNTDGLSMHNTIIENNRRSKEK